MGGKQQGVEGREHTSENRGEGRKGFFSFFKDLKFLAAAPGLWSER